jgi:hypothetical protein
MKIETIEMSVALHLLILPPISLPPPSNSSPSSISQSLFVTSVSHLTTLIP